MSVLSPIVAAVLALLIPVASAPAAHAAKMKDAPKFVAPQTSAVPKGTRVDVVADRMTYDDRSKVAVATGTVQLTYGPYVLTASRVTYDMKSGEFTANGSIVFREPNGNVLEAEYAKLKDTFKEGFARHVRALLTNDVTITAQYARRYENGVTVYEHAHYSACRTCLDGKGDPLWQIVAGEAKHDSVEHTIYYRDASLEIAGVPVFWTPYLEYPDPSVKRRTGFLLPTFHGGGSYGLGVTTPYYWDIAPNEDLTFSPMWSTQQGVLADAEWRQRLENGAYSVRGYGIRELDPNEPQDGPWRGAVRTRGSFKLNDVWSYGWDGTLTSDRRFLKDYDLDNRSMAANYVQATGLTGRDYARVQAINWRTLTDGENQDVLPTALPFITANYVFDQPVIGGELAIDFNGYQLQRSDPDPRYDLGTEQTHAMTRARWQRRMIADSGLVMTPFAEVRNDVYFSQNVPGAPDSSSSDTSVTPSAGLDVRMPFVASYGWGQSVLTPVAQIIAASPEQTPKDVANEDAITLNFDSTNLFLSDRFTGFDRQEGGVRANTGINYTLMGENGGFLRASFGESFHIAGENSYAAGSGLDGTSSDLVGGVALQLNDYLTLGYQARIEEDLSRINVQEAAVGLTFDRFSGSLNYADVAAAANYGRPQHEQQIWGDAQLMLNDSWSVFGGLRYDIEGSRFMNQTVGVAFECECMKAELSYSQQRTEEGQTDHRIMLGVELRTIGAVNGGFHL